MKKFLIFALFAILTANVYAGFGRAGSAGGFRGASVSRSFSTPRSYSYSRSYTTSRSYAAPRTVVHEYHHSSGAGIGSHLGAGMLGYMLGSANHPVAMAQPVMAAPMAVSNGGVATTVLPQGQSLDGEAVMQPQTVLQSVPEANYASIFFFGIMAVLFVLIVVVVIHTICSSGEDRGCHHD